MRSGPASLSKFAPGELVDHSATSPIYSLHRERGGSSGALFVPSWDSPFARCAQGQLRCPSSLQANLSTTLPPLRSIRCTVSVAARPAHCSSHPGTHPSRDALRASSAVQVRSRRTCRPLCHLSDLFVAP